MLEGRNLLSTYTVDHLADDMAGDGLNGSLRYCITNAIDGDTITFGVTDTINLTGALPNLTHSISLEGPGADLMTVRRNTGGDYRIFRVASGMMVSIDGLTIANGYALYDDGGGIYNQGTLTVSNSTISGNSATPLCDDEGCYGGGSGGGIYNGETLTVSNSTFSGNSGFGGGIFNPATSTVNDSIFSANSGEAIDKARGTMIVSHSTFSANSTVNTGTLTVSHSTFSGNSGPSGILNWGMLTVSNCTFSNNHGGGITNYFATLTVINTTFSGNFNGHDGGGISNDARGTVTVRNSTFSDNSGYFDGGAISNGYGSTLSVSNSTFSGNSTPDYAGLGGAIYSGGTLSLSDSTFSGNSSGYRGGGLSGCLIGCMNARNNIIAGNTAPSAPDLDGNLGSLGHNLIGSTDGGSGFDPTDLLNVDPLLGPLQDNGGPTLTMALQCGSLAIDAGDNTDAPEWDQRGEGFPRIVNKIIDIGAYEVQDGECSGARARSRIHVPKGHPFPLEAEAIVSSVAPPAQLSLRSRTKEMVAPASKPPVDVAELDQFFATARKAERSLNLAFAKDQHTQTAEDDWAAFVPNGRIAEDLSR
jgi:predicted outer membrane repeat protein